MQPGILNALTIDVEDWYHGNDFNIDFGRWDAYEDRVSNNTKRVLEILAHHQVKATFFILGYVAERHPRLVGEICQCGHEIGTHGYRHRLIYTQRPVEYREELLRSKRMIEDITGRGVWAHRAPSWSITHKSLWALDILEEEGFLYDSSIFPFLTPLFGLQGAPRFPYKPRFGRAYAITEFPPSVLKVLGGAIRIPFSGGFFLRALPYSFIRRALKSLNAMGFPAMIYIHPWELDVGQPILHAPLTKRFVHYHNLGTTEKKLRMLLREFRFAPAGEVLAHINLDSINIGVP
ncbi:MAG: DUF3473 domain-containing protein [Firmicutes bacterium]|nr:DUF3473 domain-containing protein [Bacillota bacterium]